MRAAFLLVLGLAGCNQILGVGDFHTVDGGDSGDGGPFDCPAAPANTVLGCATITHVHVDGTTTQSRQDLSGLTVAAYVSDDSPEGYQIISGSATADGVVTIEGVPDGTPYFLRLHDPQDPGYPYPRYFYTTVHRLDLGFVQLGDADAPATEDTQITLDATGLRPWQLDDVLVADSFNAGTGLQFGFASPPPPDATAYVDTIDWREGSTEISFADTYNQSARPPQLVDTAAGDDLWVRQLDSSIASTGANRGYRIITTAAATEATVSMTDGAPATITAALSELSPTGNQTFSMNLGALRTAFRDEGRYAAERVSCSRSSNPGAGYGLQAGSLVGMFGPVFGGETSIGMGLPYANPYPAAWDDMIYCSFEHQRYAIVPVTNRRMYGYSYLITYTTASDNFSFVPAIRPPTNIQVGGVDGLAGGAVDFDGVAPVTISWDEVAGVARYQIRVLGITEGFTAVFDTTETSVAMPADTFSAGNYYIFRVFAVQTASDYAGGELYRMTLPVHVGRITTGMFLFSAECGDSMPDAGEQCDSGGNSVNCDDDCSLPECGDGFFNTLANETCDEAGDAPLCDADCTVPMCRDGHWNPTIEQCDDGNATDGDGCSGACVLEDCGDGTTQKPFESCDDSNRNNGDGCSAFCQPE